MISCTRGARRARSGHGSGTRARRTPAWPGCTRRTSSRHSRCARRSEGRFERGLQASGARFGRDVSFRGRQVWHPFCTGGIASTFSPCQSSGSACVRYRNIDQGHEISDDLGLRRPSGGRRRYHRPSSWRLASTSRDASLHRPDRIVFAQGQETLENGLPNDPASVFQRIWKTPKGRSSSFFLATGREPQTNYLISALAPASTSGQRASRRPSVCLP